MSLIFIRGGDREGKAFEVRLAAIHAVRGHDLRLANLHIGVHDFFRVHLTWTTALLGSWFGLGRSVLVAHQRRDFCAEGRLIELQSLFAAAIKKQIGLDLHTNSPELSQSIYCALPLFAVV